jgi:predicted metal-dependent peptidase
MTPEANKALSKAKIDIMAAENAVFFCVVMLSLHHLWDNAQPTAYTNGTVIGYNSDFFLSLPREERAGVVLHETLHVALMHVLRGEHFDKVKFNIAADHVINIIIRDAGFKLPDWVLCDYRYRGMSTEQVYALLPDKPPGQCQMADDIRDTPAEKRDAMQDAIDDILVQAVLQSRIQGDKPGTVPGELERYVDQILNPEIPWFRILKPLITQLARDDFSYRRVNRRFMPRYTLPGMFSEKICNLAVGDDVSGSVTRVQHNHFAAETMAILKGLKPEKITFLQFDTRIVETDELKAPRDMQRVRFKGGGGTDIEPLMKWADKHRPAALIVFSDGEFTPATTNPRLPVFWIINGNPNFKAPFGKVIPYTFNGPRTV